MARIQDWGRGAARAPAALRGGIVVLFVILWEVLARLGVIDPFFFSSPSDVIAGARDLAQLPAVRHSLRVTGQAIAVGFVIGTVLGMAVGLLLGLSRLARDAYFAPVLLVMSSPKVIFIPIFLLIFGVERTATAFGAFEAFFYVVTNVVGGVDMLEDRHRRVGQAYRAGPWSTFTEIVLPAAAPGIFAGIWYGLKNAFTGVMIVELYISAGGLGEIIKQYTNLLDTGKVFAVLLTVSIVAILAGIGSARLETRLSRWRDTGNVLAG